MRTHLATAAIGAVLVLTLAACSASEDDTGVLSLDKADTSAAAQGAEGTAEEQALAFAQCMRDNGVDFPDPTVDADGNPSFEGAFGRSQEGGFEPGDDSFGTAIEACGDLMEGIAFGPGGGGDQFDTGAIEESLFAYTQCLRDEGLDVGDITLGGFGGPGGGGPGEGGEPPADLPEGAGQPGGPAVGEQGPGFDMADLFAQQLGQSPDDPAWIAANEACQSVLDGVMTGGPAGGPGGAA